MAYCSQCGSTLKEGTKFCTECGAPAEGEPARATQARIEYPAEKPKKKKRKSIFRRLWFWLLIVLAVGIAVKSGGLRKTEPTSLRRSARLPISTPAPAATPRPTEAPEAAAETEPQAAEETPVPEDTTIAELLIRPEVKEALDSYEAYMDEYIAFMQRYMAADAADMAAMMGDYADMMSRYADFAEKIDALGESELTNAELAYYLEVTSRVSRKLLSVAG